MRLLRFALLLLPWLALPLAAQAQEAATPTATPTASTHTCDPASAPEERFACASAAATEGYWDDALREFSALYADTHAAAALFNVAVAYQSLGRHLEARDAFGRVLSEHAADLDDELRSEVGRQFGIEAGRVARVRIFEIPRRETVRLRFDGRTIGIGEAEPTVIEANPGAHGLTLTESGYQEFAWEGSLADGENLELHALLTPTPATPREVYEEPAFWVGMALLAGAIAGGSVLGWWLQEDAQLDTRGGFVLRIGG